MDEQTKVNLLYSLTVELIRANFSPKDGNIEDEANRILSKIEEFAKTPKTLN